MVVRISACRKSSCCTLRSTPSAFSNVEWLCRNVCQPIRPIPSFSAAGTSQFSWIRPGQYGLSVSGFANTQSSPHVRRIAVQPRMPSHREIKRAQFLRSPSGLLDYFRTRRTWDDKQYDKVSRHDMMFVNEVKERFCGEAIEDLYKKWRKEEVTSNAVRSEYGKLRAPSEASIIFSTVNGQAALFERHPHQRVHLSGKSSEDAGFPGDFTSNVTPAWR